jgi:hypothetical protein
VKRKGIYWLASYPKSGNTWVRCLISSIRAGGAVPDLKRLGDAIPSAANCALLEKILDIPTSDLTAAELAGLRVDAYRQRAFDGDSILKVHDAYDPELFPADVSAGTVLIVRDPRDVAPSLAHHMNIDLDLAIRKLASADFVLTSRLTLAAQRLGSWSAHTRSWLEQKAGPLLVLRYEDLLADPIRRTTDLCRFLGLNAGTGVVSRAVNACRFESLQAAEESGGFPEKCPYQDRFFRRGCAGGWRDSLTCEQAARILRDHRVMLERIGYRSSGSNRGSRELVI